MGKFLSGRKSNLNLGISSFTESSTVLQTIGKVGIGTSTAEENSLYVIGNERVSGNLRVDDTVYVAGVTTVESTLLVGGATSTGTFNQTLQVDGGAYISTYVSIGYTNPFANLTVFDQSGPWIALVDPGQSSSAFEDNAGDLYIRSESGSGTAGHIIFQTGTANYQVRPSESGSNRMRINTVGEVLINNDYSTGISGQKLQVTGGAYVSGKLGVGNSDPLYQLEVIGDSVITGFTSIGKQTDIQGNLYVAGISTLSGDLTLGGDVSVGGDLDVQGHTELDNVNISGVTTIGGNLDANGDLDLEGNLDVNGHSELDNVNVSGTLTAYNLEVTNDFDIHAPDSVFYGNLTIQGDVSIGGTSILLDAETVRIEDKELILGFTTTTTPTDNTANSSGIAVASTEGHYLVPLQVTGINSLPNTYKQWLWYKHNTMGVGTTDAWLTNQAVGIGSTLVPNEIRLAVGDVKVGDFSISARNITGTAATITRGNFEVLDAKTSYIDVGFATHLQGTTLDYIGISSIDHVRSSTLDVTGLTTTRHLKVTHTSLFTGIATFQDDIYLGNDDRINLGGSNDLQIYNDGSNSYIVDDGIGNLNIRGTAAINFASADGTESYANFNVDGAVQLYYDNSKKFETTGYGVTIYNTLEVPQINISGIVTALDLDVNGHTELNTVNVSGASTFTGDIDANGNLDVEQHTELNTVNVSGASTFGGRIVGAGTSNVIPFLYSNYSDLPDAGTYHGAFAHVHSYGRAFFAHSGAWFEIVNKEITGVVGTGTEIYDIGDLTSTQLNVNGVSTFTSNIDANADLDLEGNLDVNGLTELDDVNISGVTTFGSYLDINSFVDITGPINVGGVSTFTGIGTFQSDLYVGGDLYVADDLVFDEFTARNATLTGNINGDTLIISGLSTFTTGPVLVGTGTSTGTSAQAFQVDSGAYFAGPVGVASTAPNYDLDVNGNINFNGDLYKDGILFVAGVGIGSTEVNPTSGVITPEARVGTGFTDINFVGTGLSITGYGSTVVIDLDSVGGARVSVSTEPPGGARAGDLWWESDTGDLKVYYADGDSTQWVDTNGGENLAVIGEFPPVSPLAGDLWWDSVYGQLKIYYDDGNSQQWVDTSNAGISNYWVSADPPYVGIHTNYNVGIGTTVPNEALDIHGYISIDDRVSYGTTTAETTTTSQIGIHSAVPVASYRSIDYTIQATEGGNYHTTKITALHDGSTAYYNEYGAIYNTSVVATYDVDVSGGNLRLLATPASSGITTYNIIFDAVKV